MIDALLKMMESFAGHGVHTTMTLTVPGVDYWRLMQESLHRASYGSEFELGVPAAAQPIILHTAGTTLKVYRASE